MIASRRAMILSLSLAACGGGSSSKIDAATPLPDAPGSADAAPPSAQPPAPPAPHAADGAADVTFAISKLYWGDTNRDGTANQANGWKQYGYDLDHRASTASSTDVCQVRDNASAQNVYPDGDDGIDNAFGKSLLPIFLGIAADFPTQTNDAITQGRATTLFTLHLLGGGSDYQPLSARAYAADDLGGAPKFDGTDVWPVRADAVTSPPDLATATIQLPMGWVSGNTWVSGPNQTVTLRVLFSGQETTFTIHDAVITMDLAGDRSSATHGVIAGVLSVDEAVQQMKTIAGSFDPALCSGPTIDSITAQIEQAADIGSDGTQDPGKVCDGISIGLGFDAERVVLGAVGAPAPPPVNPCP